MLLLGAVLGVIPLPVLVTEAGAMTTETRQPTLLVDPRPSWRSDAPVGSDEMSAPDEPVAPDELTAANERLEADEPDLAAARTVAEANGRARAIEDTVESFVMLGITTPEDVNGVALVRVHTGGEWGDWFPLPDSAGHGPDPDSDEGRRSDRPGHITDPVWVGDGDGYEVSLPGTTSQVEVHLVREEHNKVAVEMSAAPADAAPAIKPRSAWAPRPAKAVHPTVNDLKMAVVHHSVNNNNYSAAQVPGLIRSIQAYHMDVRGWDDIAYNFLVDRFGQTWEARGGGTRNLAVGGHSRGFNEGTVGVVVLGDFSQGTPPAAAVTAVGELLAWKFAVHGVEPTGTVPYTTSVGSPSHRPGTYTFPRIIGHRDVSSTACPGGRLYPQLGTIRSRARSRFAAHIAAEPEIILSGDFNGDGRDDILRYRRGTKADELWYGSGSGMVRASINITGTYRPVVGDFDGDGRDDILWHGSGTISDSIWYGSPSGFTNVSIAVGGSYLPFVGDFNGDGIDDIFWYGEGPAADSIWFGKRNRQFSHVSKTVTDAYQPVVADFDGDGSDDIFWYQPGPVPEVIWYGSPRTGTHTSVRPTTIPETYVPLVGDFDADGRDDLIWYRPGRASDRLWIATSRRGAFTSKALTVNGTYIPKVLDVAGDGAADIIWYAPGNTADFLWQFLPGGTYRSANINVSGRYEPVVGDYNGDGHDDVLWVSTSMSGSHLWFGQPDGLFRSIRAIG